MRRVRRAASGAGGAGRPRGSSAARRERCGLDGEQISADVIDLQGRVVEAEALTQQRLHVAPGGVAVAVGADEHVRRERGEATGDFPHVQVVHLDDARALHQCRADRIGVEARGGGLEQHPR